MSEVRFRGTVEAFRSAFRVAPEVERESGAYGGIGVYLWSTPPMREFSLPGFDETVIALHLGGSRRVRAITAAGLSAEYSAPGMLTLLPPHHPAAFRTDGSVRLITVHIPSAAANAGDLSFRPRGALACGVRFALRDDFLSASAQSLLRAATIDNERRLEYFRKVAEAMIAHLEIYLDLGRQPPAATLPDGCFDIPLGKTSVVEVQRYIDAHLGDKISLTELAAKAGLSRAWFAHNFKLGTGMSAHQFLNHRRVEAARHLLRDSNLDLAAIAQNVGFSSQSHFTSVFRSIAGCTPGQYREGAST